MSVHKLPAAANELEKVQARSRSQDRATDIDNGSESSSTGEDDDEDWNDWVSNEEGDNRPCISLFDGTSYPNVNAALAHDKEACGVDLLALSDRLRLDFHGRARLINYIRKEKPSATDVNALTGQEAFFASDEYLIPAIQDDPLLQLGSDDWSEDEDEAELISKEKDKDKVIRILSRKLQQTKKDLVDFRALVEKQLHVPEIKQAIEEDAETSVDLSKNQGAATRDDDTHYFESYGENGMASKCSMKLVYLSS